MPYDSSGRIVPDPAVDDPFEAIGRGGYAAQRPSMRGYTPPSGGWMPPAGGVPGFGGNAIPTSEWSGGEIVGRNFIPAGGQIGTPGWSGNAMPEPYSRDISDLVRRAMQNGVRDQGAADWAVPPRGNQADLVNLVNNYRPGMPSGGYGGGNRFSEPVPWTRDVSGFAMPSPKGPSPYGGGGGIAQLPWAMTPPMRGFWGDTGGDPTAYLARQQGGFGGLTRRY